MRRAAALPVLLGLASAAWGQWGPSVTPRDPIDPNAKLPALSISGLRIETKVLANLAETRTTLTIYNPHSSAVEGDLHFALPAGAVVNGYGLDVSGQMVDGVSVEKERARFVFEDIVVRQRRDPGLIEQARANEFNVRIFPIAAKGTRTVSIRYLCELPLEKEGAVLELPLRFAAKLNEASIRVEVLGSAQNPAVLSGGPWNLRFVRQGSTFAAEAELESSPAAGDVKIVFPQARQGWHRVEKAADGQFYFLIQDFPKPAPPREMEPAKRVAILWDASGSRGQSDHAKELEVLQKYFEAAADRTVEVELVLFRNEAEPARRFTIKKGDASALLAELKRVDYDGATNLGCVPPATAKPPDLYLLFSDGKNTFGPLREREANQPLYAFSSDAAPNESALRCLAEESGGAFFNLAKAAPAEAARAVGVVRSRMLKPLCDIGPAQDVYPRGPLDMSAPDFVVGRTSMFDRITLRYVDPNGLSNETAVNIYWTDTVAGEFLRRCWARAKLADLLANSGTRTEEVAALGREYSLVTPYTSLMVLETVDQYVRYKIVPPETLPDVRAEYSRRLRAAPPEDPNDTPEARCAGLWDARLQWAEGIQPRDSNNTPPAAQWPAKYVKPKVEKAPPSDYSGTLGGIFGSSGSGSSGGSSGSLFGSSASGGDRSSPGDAAPPLPPRGSSDTYHSAGGADSPPLPSRGSSETGQTSVTGPPPLPSRSAPGPVRRPLGQEWQPSGSIAGATRFTPDANASCLQALIAARPDQWMSIYADTRARFGGGLTLFLECGDFLLRHGRRADGVCVLSNLAEYYWESPLLLHWLARYLVSQEMWDEAVALLEELHARDSDDTLATRELALALAGRAARAQYLAGKDHWVQAFRSRRAAIEADYTRAIDILYHLALNSDSASDRLLFLTDLSGVLARAKRTEMGDFAKPLPSRFGYRFDADLRVVLTGGPTGGANLEVGEPGAEENVPARRGLYTWSNCSCGAQEYVLRKAPSGIYKVRLRRWGESSSLREVVHVEVITNFGRSNEQRRTHTVLLPRQLGTYTIADVYF